MAFIYWNLLKPNEIKRNQPLEPWQKKFNQWISTIRIVVEHAISGIKRCRIVKDKNRYSDSTFRNLIFNVAAGLHNLRVTRRQSYHNSRVRTRMRINLDFFDT